MYSNLFPDLSAAKILLVDDDQVALALMSRCLQEANLTTTTSAEAAWERIQSDPPDLILSDWSMSGWSGLDLCRLVKTDPAYQSCYFILLSSRQEVADRVAGLEIGADDYLTKPVLPAELKARVGVGLRTVRLSQALRLSNQLLSDRLELAETLSQTDPLTGVLNRRAFNQDLDTFLGQIGKPHRSLSLWLVDVDRFKSINDTYGHEVGDQVLQVVTARMQSRCLAESRLYRLGGDEFVCLTPGLSVKGSKSLGEQLRVAIAADPFAIDQIQLAVTLSLGGTLICDPKTQILKLADEALYNAKKLGRNQAFFQRHCPAIVD